VRFGQWPPMVAPRRRFGAQAELSNGKSLALRSEPVGPHRAREPGRSAHVFDGLQRAAIDVHRDGLSWATSFALKQVRYTTALPLPRTIRL
jgi:hypothetical protein